MRVSLFTEPHRGATYDDQLWGIKVPNPLPAKGAGNGWQAQRAQQPKPAAKLDRAALWAKCDAMIARGGRDDDVQQVVENWLQPVGGGVGVGLAVKQAVVEESSPTGVKPTVFMPTLPPSRSSRRRCCRAPRRLRWSTIRRGLP